MAPQHSTPELFSTDTTGLPRTRPTALVELADGETFELHIAPVVNELGDHDVRMLAYNGSIPGPTLRVRKGSEITVRVRNDGDHETTVHWHGLRLENAFDGVPGDTQAPIPVSGDFVYKLRFPDEGVYWYHPHVREDYGIEMGLYGNVVVDPADGNARPPVNREAIVTLDDVLIESGRIAPFRTDGPTHTAMGRFGNVMLTGGQTNFELHAQVGEVVRFYFTDTSNTRIFGVWIPGARMKLVGGDSGYYEREEWIERVLLSPSERAIVDVLFDAPGTFPIEHRTPHGTYRLGTVAVADPPTAVSFIREFETLHQNDALVRERDSFDAELRRPPDKTLTFSALMPILYGDNDAATTDTWKCPMHPEVVSSEPGTCPKCGMKLIPADPTTAELTESIEHHGNHMHDSGDGLEWEDLMQDINAQTNASNMLWKLVDADTGYENKQIDWSFRVGERVKIRLVNTMESDHPMHHPFHIHGAGRFLVISRDGVPEPNLVWKDTVLVRAGETVDVSFDVTSPGLWMAHCHIAEHNQDGMMLNFLVTDA